MEQTELERWRRRAKRERATRIEAERIAEQATRDLYLANDALAQQSQTLYHELFLRNPLPSMLIDGLSLAFIEVNEAAEQLYGLTADEFAATTLAAIQPEGLDAVGALREHAGAPVSLHCWHRSRDGRALEIDLSVHSIRWGERAALLLVAQDITRRERDRRELELRTQAIEASHNGVFICDLDRAGQPLLYMNEAMERLLDVPRATAHGQPWTELFAGSITPAQVARVNSGQPLREELQVSEAGDATQWLELQITPVADAEGTSARAIGVVIDASERKAFESQLVHLAHYDTLTQLPNRELLEQTMARELVAAEQTGQQLLVLCIDFDRFKQVNDLGGHAAGDIYLRTLAARLYERVDLKDMLARIGGDEFVLISMTDDADALLERLTRRLHTAFEQPVNVGAMVFPARCSIGATVYPRDGADPETLLRRADIAMHHAKACREAGYAVFAADMEQDYRGRTELEHTLEHALEACEFAVYYQPQVELATGRIAGLEALLRWPSGPQGLNTPDIFIPIAEQTGLIRPLGRFVLERACADLARLRAAGHEALTVAVNLSAVQLGEPELTGQVAAILERHGLPGAALELEITESALMRDPDTGADTLARLRALGVMIAIDDFGTGYSNLAYLRHLPAQRLKIDRGFIADMPRSERAHGLVRAIFDLGCHLKLTPIAEGIETEADRQRLMDLGCTLGQGFYFSRAVDRDRLRTLLDQGDVTPWRR